LSLHGTTKGHRRVGCSRRKESRSCANSSRYYLDEIEEMVLVNLKKVLADPKALRAYVDEYQKTMRELSRSASNNRDALERKLADIKGRQRRLRDLYERGVEDDADETAKRLNELSAQARETEQELEQARLAVPKIELHPQAIEAYKRDISALASRLNRLQEADPAALEPFRRLVERVIVLPGHPTEIEVKGRLGALTVAPERVVISMVAGERISPKQPQQDQLVTFFEKPMTRLHRSAANGNKRKAGRTAA
jgi:chromosome segregation ATPase